mmetsp:Transcript_23524/g.70502  ORF Transcript_23524/g.70502 Transcript_23524/m.70502 type:complete len:342 (+) Transcript_23524:1043-2068(+)
MCARASPATNVFLSFKRASKSPPQKYGVTKYNLVLDWKEQANDTKNGCRTVRRISRSTMAISLRLFSPSFLLSSTFMAYLLPSPGASSLDRLLTKTTAPNVPFPKKRSGSKSEDRSRCSLIARGTLGGGATGATAGGTGRSGDSKTKGGGGGGGGGSASSGSGVSARRDSPLMLIFTMSGGALTTTISGRRAASSCCVSFDTSVTSVSRDASSSGCVESSSSVTGFGGSGCFATAARWSSFRSGCGRSLSSMMGALCQFSANLRTLEGLRGRAWPGLPAGAGSAICYCHPVNRGCQGRRLTETRRRGAARRLGGVHPARQCLNKGSGEANFFAKLCQVVLV